MDQSRSREYYIYRSTKLDLLVRVAKSVLDQAVTDLLQKGTPKNRREKEFKDSKEFFEKEQGWVSLLCDCAEIDSGHLYNWFDGLDLK